MTGSIVTRTLADGKTKRYYVVCRAGGKQKWKKFDRKKDADRYLTTIVKSVQDGTYQEVRPVLMGDVFTAWLSDLDTRVKLEQLKKSTAETYRCGVDVHFVPAFGDIKSAELTASVMTEWRNSMADKVASGKMARKTFNNLFNQLHAILRWAREPAQSYMAHDPLIGQKRLKLQRREASFLEHEQIEALLETVAGSPEENTIIHIALFAGLRRGELFALSWPDVEWGDGAGGRLRIRRSVYRGVVTAPKTAAGERNVDVPRRVLDVLAALRATRPRTDQGFIFRTATGLPTDPGSWYRRTFAKIRERAELPETIGLHSLRHTYASLLINQGENPKYISAQLGHASTAFTMDVYGHLFRKTSDAAMGRLNEMIPVPVRAGLRAVGGCST